MPPGRVTSRHHSKVCCLPSASIATSTPRPPVSRLMAATGSSWVKSITSLAPISRERFRRFSMASTPMMSEAPFNRAPAVAHSPIGPWAKTATVWPICTLAVSAAEIPVEAMSASSTHCSSVRSSGILARLPCAYGTRKKSACTPSMELPRRQPPIISHSSSCPEHCELSLCWQKKQLPHGVIALTRTRSPTS